MYRFSNFPCSIIAILVSCQFRQLFASDSYKNVYGDELEPCSQPNANMALTGYTRNGSCIGNDDDSGSHHICIDLSSTEENFCTVTGQPDWCSSTSRCDTGNNGSSGNHDNKDCPIVNWCVCQWAFASYISKAGGCDNIQNIQCNAINLQALSAYAALADTSDDVNGEYSTALRCIEHRCSINSSNVLNTLPTLR